MYEGQESINVRASIRYQDGTEGVVETEIRVATMD